MNEHAGHDHSEGFLTEFLEILTDPAHILVEITVEILMNLLFLGLVWPGVLFLLRRYVMKEHLKIDKEHGIDHEEVKNDNRN